jgi:hypothetical protein
VNRNYEITSQVAACSTQMHGCCTQLEDNAVPGSTQYHLLKAKPMTQVQADLPQKI